VPAGGERVAAQGKASLAEFRLHKSCLWFSKKSRRETRAIEPKALALRLGRVANRVRIRDADATRPRLSRPDTQDQGGTE
jgi:hypothetical protein